MNSHPDGHPDPYKNIGEFYDREHDDFTDDIELILQFSEAEDGPILEMGSGSGRVLVALASQGLDVAGLDCSSAMLTRGRERAQAASVAPRFHRASMESVASVEGQPYGMILYTLNALTHIVNQQDQLKSLKGAWEALGPSGLLFLDLPNPTPEYLSDISGKRILEWSGDIPGDGVMDKWTWRTIEPISQSIGTRIWYDHLKADGGTHTVRTEFNLRYLHFGELTQMLERCGFSTIRAYGSYMLDPLDSGSDRMIVTAMKSPC